MTDEQAINAAVSAVETAPGDHALLRRNGRAFMALPSGRAAAARTLGLYQPQRWKARGFTSLMKCVALAGLHRLVLPRCRHVGGKLCLDPAFDGCLPGTAGVLLGSPEHRVRRAIASYQNAGEWEVAKISFGDDGRRVLQQEARTLGELHPKVNGVPRLLGLHQGDGMTLLRMPYLTGRPVKAGKPETALRLLERWITDQAPRPVTEFPEWPAIESALSGDANGRKALDLLSRQVLRPVVCHGDFARWNLLRQADGRLVVLDWEWGHADGMPGIDLAHYFLQDARLVRRMSAADAIAATLRDLERPGCRKYLQTTGWSGNPLLAITASLAYKQGAGHQENAEVLEAAVAASMTLTDFH